MAKRGDGVGGVDPMGDGLLDRRQSLPTVEPLKALEGSITASHVWTRFLQQ
jgi:hypothetical protein